MSLFLHEGLDRARSSEPSPDRSFGFVFAGFLGLIGLWPVLHRHPPRFWALCVSPALLLIAIAAPNLLHPLNIAWTRFGQLFAKITNPIVTGAMFYAVFTPAAIVLRLLGKDSLRLKYDRYAISYWILREPPGPTPESMRNQF